MVSNTFAKSIGLGGSAPIKAKSISEGGGCCDPASKASNGSLGAAKPIHKKTLQNSAVNPGSGAKGHRGSVDKKATTKDPLQKGGRAMPNDRKGFSGSIGGSAGAGEIGSSSIGEGDGRSRTPDSERGAGSIIGRYDAPNGVLLRGKPSIVDSGKGIRPKVKYPTAPGVSSRAPGPIRTPSSGGKAKDTLR